MSRKDQIDNFKPKVEFEYAHLAAGRGADVCSYG
jgi:hypothetical protein